MSAGPVAPSSAVPDLQSAARIRRGVIFGTSSQLAAKIVHLGLNIASTLAVVRYLGPADYGTYALVLTVTTLVTLIADFGLPKLAVRDICAASNDALNNDPGNIKTAGNNNDPGNNGFRNTVESLPDPSGVTARTSSAEADVLGSIVVVRLVLAVLAVGVTQLVLLVLDQGPLARVAALVGSLTGIGEAVLGAVVVVFQVRMAQQVEAFLRTGAELVETAAVLSLVAAGAALPWLFAPAAVTVAAAGLIGVRFARRRVGGRPRFVLPVARRLVVRALPIAPALLVAVLYRKLDSLGLAEFRSRQELGWYAAAAQPVEYTFLATALLMNVLFPLVATAWTQHDRRRFAALYRRGVETLVLVTVLGPVLLAFVARPLVVRVYGADFAPSARPMLLLSVAMVLLTVNAWQSLMLLISDHQAVTLLYNTAGLLVAAALCWWLIPAHGTDGAGVAAIGTATAVLVASTVLVRRRLGVCFDVGALGRVGLTAAVTAAVLAAMTALHVPWPVVVVIGVATFAVAARGLGAHRSVTGLVS